MEPTFTAPGKPFHIALLVALLSACATNLTLVCIWL
jgi:hypothetical protein